eukprot:TRINITY_DN1505_c0_g1_i2.p2 TRINITY_DN1505_c0_g1~~TRINITY_DN1505_c0_g1_i2.p2  ORF type:complete len:106 (-),score=18.01 TRINITY_DN1505_c0_g1_i2:188-505(-)
MKSIVHKLEEPLSYYSYKKRKPDIREAIERPDAGGAKQKITRFRKAANKFRSKSCVRGNPGQISLAKYNGVGETIKSAKSELTALGDQTYKSRIHLKHAVESKQL